MLSLLTGLCDRRVDIMSGKIELEATPFGLVSLKNGKVAEIFRFGDTLEENVDRYRKLIERGVVNKKLMRFAKKLSKEKIYTSSPSLARVLRKLGVNILYEERDKPVEVSKLLVESGLFSSLDEADRNIREALRLISIQRIREEMVEKDKVIIHAIEAYDECTELINTLYERLREWYGLHFPELEKIVRKYKTYSNLVEKVGWRENYSFESLVKLGLDEKLANRIVKAAEKSIGVSIDEADMVQVREHARFLSETIKRRERLERYIDDVLSKYAPNTTALIGSKLAAKLISRAGGLRKLSTLPASTIQLLGAEKALFRALRRGALPPKHGIIFQHPAVSQAPRRIRGKISRALAAKIAIAARVDVFGTEVMGEKLKEDFERKVKEIYGKTLRRKKK